MAYRATTYEIFNLGNNRTVSLIEMIESLEKALGIKAQLAFLNEQPGDVPQTWADLEKARRCLHYDPATDFNEGIRQFVDWLARNRLPYL